MAIGYGRRVRGSVVVVVNVFAAMLALVTAMSTLSGCPPSRVEPEPDCLTFVDCYLPPAPPGDALPESGYGLLAQHAINPEEPELRCYAGFLGEKNDGARGDGSDIELLLGPMRRAYGDEGSCWAEGYGAVAPDSDDDAIAAGYQATCLQVCQQELLAECRRKRDGDLLACPDLAASVDAFCAAHSAAEIDDARCPGAEGEGE